MTKEKLHAIRDDAKAALAEVSVPRTPLHRAIQVNCGNILELIAEIERLREGRKPTVALCVNIARRLRDPDGFVDAVDEAADLIEWVGQTPGLLTIAAERHRHLEEEGWTAVHDDGHHRGELAYAAFCYCQAAAFQQSASLEPKRRSNWWPWEDQWWKPSDDPERNLVKAGALILAEIARRRRLAASQPPAVIPENAVCACDHPQQDHSASGCLARSCGCEKFTARPDVTTAREDARPTQG